jgi:hypothetical protein
LTNNGDDKLGPNPSRASVTESRFTSFALARTAREHVAFLVGRLLGSSAENDAAVAALRWLGDNGCGMKAIADELRGAADRQQLGEQYPWLEARVPDFDEEWRKALDDALAEISGLPLPPDFKVTEIYNKRNALGLEWVGGGEVEDALEAVAGTLEDSTQGEMPLPE